jgi:hypothetical protein
MKLEWYIFFLVLLVLTSLLSIKQRSSILHVGYDIAESKNRLNDLAEKSKIMRYQISAYTAPQTLDEKSELLGLNLGAEYMNNDTKLCVGKDGTGKMALAGAKKPGADKGGSHERSHSGR